MPTYLEPVIRELPGAAKIRMPSMADLLSMRAAQAQSVAYLIEKPFLDATQECFENSIATAILQLGARHPEIDTFTGHAFLDKKKLWFISSIIDKKVRSVAGAQDIDVVCPIHGLPMVPRERKNIEVVLDRWIEECPHPGCGQTRKLKDFAQLAALLRRITGEGMLG